MKYCDVLEQIEDGVYSLPIKIKEAELREDDSIKTMDLEIFGEPIKLYAVPAPMSFYKYHIQTPDAVDYCNTARELMHIIYTMYFCK